MTADKMEPRVGAIPSSREGDKFPLPILLAEDEDDDAFLLVKALKSAGLMNPPTIVHDGEEAIDYLAGRGIYADRARYPFPFLLLLDLKMPRKNGFEVLEWWRSQPRAQHLNTIVLTSSSLRQDIERAYELGAVSYLLKPAEISDLTELVARTLQYWRLVRQPFDSNKCGNGGQSK
jgi:CheY-like chemotaxis protein